MSSTVGEWPNDSKALDEGVDFDADNNVGEFLPDEDVVDEGDIPEPDEEED